MNAEPGRRVILVGSKSIAVDLAGSLGPIIAAIVTIDDRLDSRTRFDDLHRHCEASGVPFHVAERRADVSSLVLGLSPDLVIVAGWYWLIPEDVLRRVQLGVLGVHYSALPTYRGGSPLVWALINGEPSVGTTVFQMTPGLDDGPIWGQRIVDVEPSDDINTISNRLAELSVDLVAEVVPTILSGEGRPTEQDHTRATYCLQRRPEDGAIRWESPGDQIVRFVRAQTHPYPGAFTTRGGERIAVWRAHEFDRPVDGTAGQVTRVEGTTVVVCGQRSGVVLDEASIPLRPGDRLSGQP